MIFLCFSSGDRYTIVKSCLYHLKNYGLSVWYDYHELILGDMKREKNFIDAIQTSDYYIIIYSSNFLQSPCAIAEESLIFEESAKRNVCIFPLIYNLQFNQLPTEVQKRLENLIYNEITDSTGCIDSVNQMVVKVLIDKMGYNEFNATPYINLSLVEKITDKFLRSIMNEYLNISPDNFNARICVLYCVYKYTREVLSEVEVPVCYCKAIEYLSNYTRLNIPYNHKELIIAELITICILRLI